jgi:predicted nucleotidyltransferase
VFGSVARGDADDASDVDFLVEMEAGRTLGDLVELEQELSALLGCQVDVGTSLRPAVRARTGREAVPL